MKRACGLPRHDAGGHARPRRTARAREQTGPVAKNRWRCPRPFLRLFLISGQIAATPWQQTLSLCFWFSLNVDSHGERRTIYFFRIIIPTDQREGGVGRRPRSRSRRGHRRGAAAAAALDDRHRHRRRGIAAPRRQCCRRAVAGERKGGAQRAQHTRRHNNAKREGRPLTPPHARPGKAARSALSVLLVKRHLAATPADKGTQSGWRRPRRSARARARAARQARGWRALATPAERATTHRHEQCVFLCCFLPKDGVPVPICVAGAGAAGGVESAGKRAGGARERGRLPETREGGGG